MANASATRKEMNTLRGLTPFKAAGSLTVTQAALASLAADTAICVDPEVAVGDFVIATIQASPSSGLGIAKAVTTNGVITFTIWNSDGAISTSGTMTIAYVVLPRE